LVYFCDTFYAYFTPSNGILFVNQVTAIGSMVGVVAQKWSKICDI
jgi:hypothetical protein